LRSLGSAGCTAAPRGADAATPHRAATAAPRRATAPRCRMTTHHQISSPLHLRHCCTPLPDLIAPPSDLAMPVAAAATPHPADAPRLRYEVRGQRRGEERGGWGGKWVGGGGGEWRVRGRDCWRRRRRRGVEREAGGGGGWAAGGGRGDGGRSVEWIRGRGA
jgi:hypothetical protein